MEKYLPKLDYDDHITYIPLDLSGTKKSDRGPWREYIDDNEDIKNQLDKIKDAKKIIDAGGFILYPPDSVTFDDAGEKNIIKTFK